VLPGPLADLIGPVAALRFTWVFPGVRQVEIPVPTSGMPLRLFQLHPDMRVPDHTHRGRELSLVLSGGFRDDSGHFVRGDICERHQERHRQHIDPGEPCLVLVLADAPLVPYTLRGWLAGVLRKV
jgi:putative transcriptional regulator